MAKFYERLCEELILYVRMVAWLNTPPKDDKRKPNDPPTLSRLQKMRLDRKDQFFHPALPGLGAPHVAEYLWASGPVLSNTQGRAPLPHSELVAWQSNSGIELTPWESATLRRLSSEYLNECHAAESPACPSPMAPQMSAEDRGRVSKQIASGMQMLMATRPKR